MLVIYIQLFILIQILQFQEPPQTNTESTLSIPSLDSESISNSSQGNAQTRKKRGLARHLDISTIISSDKRSKGTRNDKKYTK